MIPTDPAGEHRAIAGTFTRTIRGVAPAQWSGPTPVAEWEVRDIVRHLLEWFPDFLAGGSDVRLPEGPSVDDDPLAAWEHHAAAVQAVLDDPASATTSFAHPRLPEMPLPEAVAQFYTNDIFMHTWDLARATGQDDTLDADRCRSMVEAMEPMDQLLRQSGQYGPRVAVAEDASWQDRLIGFIGRDPTWGP